MLDTNILDALDLLITDLELAEASQDNIHSAYDIFCNAIKVEMHEKIIKLRYRNRNKKGRTSKPWWSVVHQYNGINCGWKSLTFYNLVLLTSDAREMNTHVLGNYLTGMCRKRTTRPSKNTNRNFKF